MGYVELLEGVGTSELIEEEGFVGDVSGAQVEELEAVDVGRVRGGREEEKFDWGFLIVGDELL